MRWLDVFGAFEVGDGAADFEQTAVGMSAESQFINRDFEQLLRFRLDAAVTLAVSRADLRIGVNGSSIKARRRAVSPAFCPYTRASASPEQSKSVPAA